MSALQVLQDDITGWSAKTFPDQSLKGKLRHLQREAGEWLAAPEDRSEAADCLILLLGAAALQGIDANELIRQAQAKMEKNRARKWGPPDGNGVYHHINEPVRVGLRCEVTYQGRRAAGMVTGNCDGTVWWVELDPPFRSVIMVEEADIKPL